MADFKKLSWVQSRLKPTPRMSYEDINPDSGWTNDPRSRSHQLLLDLPGFKKDDIKLQIDDSGTIVISGGRRVSENKRTRFQKTFKVPEDSDIKGITTEFKGDTFEVNIPKMPKKMNEEPENKNGASSSRQQVVEEKREESENSKDVKEAQERPNESDRELKEIPEEKVEEKENSETKEEPEIKRGEEIASSEEAKAMKEAYEERREECESSKETSRVLSNDVREGYESSKDGKETEEKPVTKRAVLSDIREEYHSSHETNENDEKLVSKKAVLSSIREEYEESEYENGALNNDVKDEKKEGSESAKVMNENEEESEALKREAQREENVEKPDERGNELKNSHPVKGKDNPSNGKTAEKSVMGKIIEQRSILLASIISFTLGVLVSRKFHNPSSK